jgi:small conductance mechanosensitive channel
MIWHEFLNELNKQFLSPERFAHFLFKLLTILLIILIAIVIYRFVSWLLCRFLRKHQHRRTKTIIPLINSILKYLTLFIMLIAVLREFGVNYGAILAGAGVIGLAVGFGAQNLIKDIISGFFILFEGLIDVGDVITVGDEGGVVENIGLRTTQFREFSGLLRTIPNGELTRFGNCNRGFMRALVAIDIDYDSNIDKCIAITDKVAREWAKQNQNIVLAEPSIQRILNYTTKGTNCD